MRGIVQRARWLNRTERAAWIITLNGAPARQSRCDHAACTRPRQDVNGNLIFQEDLQDSDVGQAARKASAERHANARPRFGRLRRLGMAIGQRAGISKLTQASYRRIESLFEPLLSLGRHL